ncbi:MAG: hypothetical protein GQ525_14460 [Draconibacterium sp.]|nr:hypothetical protein [Draconibacterium sp.]
MGRFSRVIILIGLIVFPTLLFAQSFNNNTSSPYSRFGMGDLQSYGFGRSAAMGGASIASRYNQQINMTNPASYSAIDSLTFMFEFGIDGTYSNFKNDLGSATANNVNFQYFAMKFQLNNWIAASLGLIPFSDMGYTVDVVDEIDNVGAVLTKYYGAGTVSNAFFGVAVEPIENVSIGANLNYMFGKLNHNAEVYFLEASDFYGIQQYGDFRLTDFAFDFGVQVTLPLKNNNHIVFAAIFENSPEYTTYFSNITQKNLSSGNAIDQDTLFFTQEEKSPIVMPLTLGGGISFVKKDVLEINVDYFHQSWSNATFFGSQSDFLTDLNKFAVGGEWIPNKFSIRSYTSKIAYRVGFKYEETYLMFGDQQINDFGISFGVGLPVYRTKSTINLAAEFGRRGTTNDGLVLENYGRFNLSLNLYDLWFIKRKIE